MKPSLIILSLVAIAGASTVTAESFRVSGNIAGHGGRVLLLRYVSPERADTLGNVVTPDGDFCFTGTVESPFEARVKAVGTRVDVPVFIEPGMEPVEVKTSAHSGRYDVTGGGELQECGRRYTALERAARAERDSITAYYNSTYDMNDFFWRIQLKGALQKAGDRFEEAEDKFIAGNDNMVSASVIVRRLSKLTRDKTLHKKYALLGPTARESEVGRWLGRKADLSAQISVGGIAPDFTMGTPEGGTLSLHGVKAKVKILDFWASWCGPCRAENPNVRQIYEKYHDKGLEVISVSLDTSRGPWVKAIEKDSMTWLHASDLDGPQATAKQIYKVYAIPYMLILDGDNRIISEGLRGKELEDFIAKQFD